MGAAAQATNATRPQCWRNGGEVIAKTMGHIEPIELDAYRNDGRQQRQWCAVTIVALTSLNARPHEHHISSPPLSLPCSSHRGWFHCAMVPVVNEQQCGG